MQNKKLIIIGGVLFDSIVTAAMVLLILRKAPVVYVVIPGFILLSISGLVLALLLTQRR